MENKLFEIKAGIAAAMSTMGLFLGWKGIMAVVWVVAMCLDYISGTAAACKKGEWSSAVAREGLWHKSGMILVVVVAAIADGVMVMICANMPDMGINWPGIILPLVLAWYIITEFGSVLENAVKMGAAVPDWLVKLLKVSLVAINKKAEPIQEEEESEINLKEEKE